MGQFEKTCMILENRKIAPLNTDIKAEGESCQPGYRRLLFLALLPVK